MIRHIAFVAALAFAVPAQAQATTQKMLQLQPATPWALDYADDSCRLVRTFGSGADEVTLGLTAYEPGGLFYVSAVGEPTRVYREEGTVRLALGEDDVREVAQLGVVFADRPGLLIINPLAIGQPDSGAMGRILAGEPLSVAAPEREAAITSIGFVDGFEREFVLQTGSLGQPMQALRECTSELMSHWEGIDPVAQAARTRVPVPTTPAHSWLTVRDLPRALRRQMLINYRLTVDADGKPDGCHVAAAAQTPELASAACESLLAKARFRPALDAAGEPMRSYFSWYAVFR